MTTILVAGASGFVGRRLVPALLEAGHDVRAMTRNPSTYTGEGVPLRADVEDVNALYDAMRGCSVAYYLVHSLDHRDFAERDALGAQNFGAAAKQAGVERIVYLGGLGAEDDDLSAHLRSRQQVEVLLAHSGVPVTTLRAGIVIGHGGASWEIIRNMVERVPAMVVPRWALTRSQPIALSDVVRYLVGVLSIDDDESHMHEIGGSEILRYVDVLSRVSAIEGRPAVIVPVPLPAKKLATFIAAQVLPFVVGVDSRTILTLLQSMKNEVIVRDDTISAVVDLEPMDYDAAVLEALAERARERRAS